MHIGKTVDDDEKKRVSFLLPEDLPGLLDAYPHIHTPKGKTVKGYTVRTRIVDSEKGEAIARRKAIAAVVAR